MTIDGGHFASHWNPPSVSNVYSSSGHNIEVPHYQQDTLGQNPFLHLPAAGTFPMGPDNYVHHASSSNYEMQTFHGMDNGFVDLTMGNGRGPYKRKSPGIPPVFERGSTSRFYSAGSSSDLSISADLLQEKPNTDSQNMLWDHINLSPGYRGSGLSIGGEGSLRNVRSRSALDLESNLARTHLSANPSRNSYSTSHPIDYSSSVDLLGSNASSREWNHILSPAHGRTPISG